MNTELYHHGIIGQKWGVRRFQNKDGSLTAAGKRRYSPQEKADKQIAKIGNSKTRMGKNYHNVRAFNYETQANREKALNKNENVRKTIDSAIGFGRSAADWSANANYYSRKAAYSKTNFGKGLNAARAFNSREYAKTAQRIHNAKTIREAGKIWVDSFEKQRVRSWSGREVSLGSHIVGEMLGINTILDISYARNEAKR